MLDLLSPLPRLDSFKSISEVWSYDPETGVILWSQGFGPHPYVGTRPVSTRKSGDYIVVKFLGYGYKAHRLAWMLHYGEWPANVVDHVNGNRTDNRISNLRDVTLSENSLNQKRHRLVTENAQNGTEPAENGTTALARVRQNGTVPCRLCRSVPCAVCAVSVTSDPDEAFKARLSKDPRFAAWAAGAKA